MLYVRQEDVAMPHAQSFGLAEKLNI